MTNTEAWDRIAARGSSMGTRDAVEYGPELPTETDLRLFGDVKGKRVLDLGCGGGANAVVLARQGAHVIAIDRSASQLAVGRRLADAAEVRVEWHQSDAADLAFLRADSIDAAISTNVLAEVEDIDRVFRQVHRVLRPGSSFVFSYEHPLATTVGREDALPGALPLGRLEVRRSYFEPGPMKVVREGEDMSLFPRPISDVFAALHRAGYRVDAMLEPEPSRSADPGPTIPPMLVWRARKEGV
jgi:SAM-dependent methyltransferase